MPGIAGWWNPLDSHKRGAEHTVEMIERRVAFGIALFVPLFAVIGAVIMFSAEGPVTLPRRLLCGAVLISTIPVGAWWLLRGRRSARMPGWFVFYADAGVALVLITFTDRGLALHVAVLFAVIGVYIVYFSPQSVLLMHSAFVNSVILVLAVGTYIEGVHDLLSVIARALVALIVLNSVIVFRAVIQAQLELANTDSLTGLLNRRGFGNRIEILLDESDPGDLITLFVVDIDQFKSVNDTHGHAAGDEVLRATADRLAAAVPEGACLARTGGEEFTVAVAAKLCSIAMLAERLSAAVHRPEDRISITGSIGAAVLSVDSWKSLPAKHAAEVIHSALSEADDAMYEAKRSGGNRAKVFGG